MVTGIIMAAGFSKRMGEDKLLMEIDGVKMVERVICNCKNSL
ncbi:MAG: NTP transferase domain-containing protein, partial [Tissierellia bacterium]|nr:NTP transferase domain-containing protein [Tissierellia bacterium]